MSFKLSKYSLNNGCLVMGSCTFKKIHYVSQSYQLMWNLQIQPKCLNWLVTNLVIQMAQMQCQENLHCYRCGDHKFF